ncbi:MAG: TspO/MBR family protein [Patescibacteria group bacterium]
MKKSKRKFSFNWKLALAILVCLCAGIIGSVFTGDSVDTWYVTLVKPSFNPPGWVFGPVWTLLYIMMGISFYLIWINDAKKKISAYGFFTVQLLLNASWSIIFFGLQNVEAAMVNITFLWIAIIVTIVRFYQLDKKAAYLLIPYLCWVTFASILNYAIMQLN